MYEALDPGATDRALQFRIDNPPTPKAPAVSIWGQAGEMVAAPFKGLGQGAMQSARVANTVAPTVVGNPLAMTSAEQENMLGESGITRRAIDQDLKRGVQSLRPDPVSATVASQFLQEGARVLGKVAAYGIAAGPVGAVVGTGLDEGVTGAQELMDRGVDPATAAKAGAVRGVAIGASVALPVVGQTALRTVGLVAAGGPGLFMAEQALTRDILERANHGAIAQEYDPLDPMGLLLSVAVPGAVGLVVHRARVRRGQTEQQARALDDMAQDPEMVDAALISHRTQTVSQSTLGRLDDPQAAAGHTKALDAAMQALDEGAPVRIADAVVDPAVASRALADLDTRLNAARAELQVETPDLTITPAARLEPSMEPVTTPTQTAVPANMADTIVERVREAVGVLVRGQQRTQAPDPAAVPQRTVAPEVQRAQDLADRMPDMPIRMDDDGSAPMRAADVMDQVRRDAQQDSAEARKAFDAAVTCFLETS